jgi:internalin A
VFGQLQNLSDLFLIGNELSELPASFGQLQNLSYLNLSLNQLSELPAWFGQLQNLSYLCLGGNELSELAESFEQLQKLQNLRQLDLGDNQLSELPTWFGQLQNLRQLDLEDNQLLELPKSLFELKNLRILSLNSNKIRQLPKEILHFNLKIEWDIFFGQYKGIYVKDNPFETPPIEIIKQGTEAIANYYAAIEQQPRPLNESKLILIGDGGAGKTSLMKCLLGQEFNPQESQTHGININTLGFKHQDQDIKLHCWDFGGQQIMHATHQFFLSKRSLYILVLDSRRETQAEYWLKHIQTFGNNAPVIIAINKIDENPHFSLSKRKLLQQYPNIKYIARISCATQDGINDLKNQIQNRLADIELLHTLFPETWFRVKTTIVEQAAQTNFASYEQFVDLCEKNGIQKESEQNTLINFLHDLGIVIHFQDRWLRETNVINPQWITEAIYSIINAPQLVGGKLHREQLIQILDNTIYPIRKHDYIIELMKKFELCYALNDDEFLLPDLFNNEEPEFDFDDNQALRIIFDYDFLPSSIFTRFIVRMHNDIHNNIYWRKGCLLHNANYHSSALIETNNNQITLQINGQQAREYLTVLQFILNDLNNRFNNLKIITKIGLPDAPQTTVNQDYLLQLANKGQKVYIPPEMPDKSYNIADLLGMVYNENLNEHQTMHMFHTIITILQDMGLKQEELLEKGDELLRDKGRKDIVEIRPGIGGVSVNLKEIWRRMVNK